MKESHDPQRETVEPRLLGSTHFEPTPRTGATVAGTVIVRVTVDQNGCVQQLSLVRRHPDNDISEQARRFVTDALFAPAKKNGKFVSGQSVVVLPIHVR